MATPKQVQQRVITVPFQIGADGSVAFATQTSVIAAQEIKAALLTNEGERLMRPFVGSPFALMLWGAIPSEDADFILHELQAVLARQCRYSAINFVRVDTTQPGVFAIEVGFTPLAFHTTLAVSVDLSTVVQTN